MEDYVFDRFFYSVLTSDRNDRVYLFKEANEGGRIRHHPDAKAQDNNGKNLGKVLYG